MHVFHFKDFLFVLTINNQFWKSSWGKISLSAKTTQTGSGSASLSAIAYPMVLNNGGGGWAPVLRRLI